MRPPATMSTQHPDNATPPPWARGEYLTEDEEVYETIYVYRDLGCREQMWDWEGKDVDPYVVRKLLERYGDFFRDHVLGRDLRLTYRLPNPWVEVSERKVFAEALETIPRAYDEALAFYGRLEVPPVFEVILPLTRSHREVLAVLSYYRKVVGGRCGTDLGWGYSVADVIGEVRPREVSVIPLIEDREGLLRAGELVRNFIKAARPTYVRVFFARSDPALNYGLIPAVLMVKAAYRQVMEAGERCSVPVYTIVGTGTPRFRGGLEPERVDEFLREYGCFHTVTIQSSFKYDHPVDRVREAVSRLEAGLGREREYEYDEGLLRGIIDKLSAVYRSRIEKLAPLVNHVACYIPRRRVRRLHIGLYGYSRDMGGVRLPRAIRFTASLYTLGMPPEILGVEGLHGLTEEEWDLLESLYLNWRDDLRAAASFVCWENLNDMLAGHSYELLVRRLAAGYGVAEVMRDLEYLETTLGIKAGGNDLRSRLHANAVNSALLCISYGMGEAVEYIVEAGRIRGFLG